MDRWFAPRQETGWRSTIPSALKRCHETFRIKAFGLTWKPGDPEAERPHVYWDSDVAKVMEGMALSLIVHPDPEMEAELNRLVDIVLSAQQPDGYLNTHFPVTEQEDKWKKTVWTHELYCAGHLMEAAVAHFRATGRRNFLDGMRRYGDLIARLFGKGPGQMPGYPGHEEIELALVKLHRATGERKWLDLARYFIDERGASPNWFLEIERATRNPEDVFNYQASMPVREQKEAVGHAVRAVYLYCGMVDVAVETDDRALLEAVERLFDNIAQKRMYITGGIGSSARCEAFTQDYDLPNTTAYAESCAAVGLALLAKRLLDATGHVRYADVLERVLYNNALSGIGLSGDRFFYANLLEVNGSTMEFDHVKKTRQPWFDCSCCPTTYCRFLPQIGDLAYGVGKDALRIDIPAAARIVTEQYEVVVSGDYPNHGDVEVKVVRGGQFVLRLRIPDWTHGEFNATLGGAPVETPPEDGYLVFDREWRTGDAVQLHLDVSPRLVWAHPRVGADAGRVAICRGPVVYCLEGVDNPGVILGTVRIRDGLDFRECSIEGLPAGTVGLAFDGISGAASDSALYRDTPPVDTTVELRAVPYALWQNRGPSDMQVWLLKENVKKYEM